MKRIISLVLAVILCLALSVGAFAAESNQGGGRGSKTSPKTGTAVVAALAITACTAGGVSILANSKSKK